MRQVALGVALCEASNGVRELGGENRGPRVRAYLNAVGINVPAPWCAAFVQYCTDVAFEGVGQVNPLNDVALEALVQSYFNWANEGGHIIRDEDAMPGDLILFKFGGKRWDHIGFVVRSLHNGEYRTVEGNTSAGVGASQAEREREGDGVFIRRRQLGLAPTCIVRWSA